MGVLPGKVDRSLRQGSCRLGATCCEAIHIIVLYIYHECRIIEELKYLKEIVNSLYHHPIYLSFQFSRSVVSDFLRPHGLQHTRLPCPSPTPKACSNTCPSINVMQPSHLLFSPFPPAFNLSQRQSPFQWISSSHQVAKVLELQLQHQSFQWIIRTDFF